MTQPNLQSEAQAANTGESGTKRGVIYTFYSYKGGVGRSMALANVAALLAKWGKRVLVVDWDLEAPGIEKYFGLTREEKPGMVDLIVAHTKGGEIPWRDCLLSVSPFGNGHEVSIITAGKDIPDYPETVQNLDWGKLFEENDLGSYLEQLRNEWAEAYEFVLVDSRTGINDIGGICTILLPDVLVLMLITNRQSLDGVIDVMQRARGVRDQLPVDRSRLVAIPVPARDESRTEYDNAKTWRQTFASELGEFYQDWVPKGMTSEQVLNVMRIPYIPYWSFGERLPVVEEGTTDPTSLGAAYEVLARLISSGLQWEQLSKSIADISVLEQIMAAAALWQGSGRQSADLIRGSLLKEAEGMLRGERSGLSPAAAECIRASLAQRRRGRFIGAVPGVVTLLAVFVALWQIGIFGGGSASSAPVASVSLAPEAVTLIEGELLKLDLTLKDREGNILKDRTVTWSSMDPGVATVESVGQSVRVTAIASGVVTITATVEGQSGSATISVIPVPVAFVSVTPDTATVIGGGQISLRATLKDVTGNVLTSREVTWASSNPEVATVESTRGLVTAITSGVVTITATAGGRRGEATIRVMRAPIASASVSPAEATITEGKSISLVAQLRDEAGNELTNRVVVWVSSNPGVAAVEPRTGLVTGVALGATTITATSEGRTGAATIKVILVPVATVGVKPDTVQVTQGTRVQLMAILRDSGNNALADRQVTWSSSNTGAAVVDGSGLVVGIAPGISAVTATSEGKSGTAVITVVGVVASVLVSPDTKTILQGESTLLEAVLKDDLGNTLEAEARSVEWFSGNPEVAGVDPATGLITGIAPGCGRIKAVAKGKFASKAFITVIPSQGSSRQLLVSFESKVDPKSVSFSDFSLKGFAPVSTEMGREVYEVILTLNTPYSFPPLPALQVVGAITDDFEGRPAKVICIQPVVLTGAQRK